MGGWAARKCLQLIENVENVLAIELLAACQGLDLRMPLLVRKSSHYLYPMHSLIHAQTTAPLQAVHAAIRTKVAPWDKDRYFHPDLVAAAEMIRDNKLVTITEPFLTDKQIEFDNDSDDNESKPHQH
jgi:histidine ammonia-lyase